MIEKKKKKKEKNKKEGTESRSCAALLPLQVAPGGPVDDDGDVRTSRACPSL
jgi:hypothetical protein